MTDTKTCWVEMNGVGHVLVHSDRAMSRSRAWCNVLAFDFGHLFGWLPGKRPVEVRLEKVDRRKDGTMKPNRKPRVKAKGRGRGK